jgi:mRNA-degrading endonuclease RelE of RelBE toxin-antitoxin system
VWRVELASQAARTLRKLHGEEREHVMKAIDALRTDPRPPGKHVKALEGAPEPLLRYRAGDHRIVYAEVDAGQVVVIRGIVARKDLDKWLRTAR